MYARAWLAFAVLLGAALVVACVDGKTPDCSTPSSGCYPGDSGMPSSDADASDDGDATSVPDASDDADAASLDAAGG